MNTPFPPVNSGENRATGPAGRGFVVVVVVATAFEAAVVESGPALLALLEQAARPANAMHKATRPTVCIATPPG